MGRSDVSTSVVKWHRGLCERVSIIIRRYIERMRFSACMAVWVITFFHISLVLFSVANIYRFIFVSFCLILYIMHSCCVMFMYSYYYLCSVLGILFHCVVLCIVCV
jgi:hypothetical protein